MSLFPQQAAAVRLPTGVEPTEDQLRYVGDRMNGVALVIDIPGRLSGDSKRMLLVVTDDFVTFTAFGQEVVDAVFGTLFG